MKFRYKECTDCASKNNNINASDANSVKKKPQSIIDASNLDTACDEASQKYSTSKNIDASFKEEDKRKNEDDFDFF